MKTLIGIVTFLLTTSFAWAGDISDECEYKGIKLFGNVKIVESAADMKIEIDTSFPDLRVKVTDWVADECGEWNFVESGEDFTVEFVDHFGDVEIKFVEYFPGPRQ